MKPPRVGIVGLLQESNTFIDGQTTLRHFEEDLLLRGEEIRTRMQAAPHEVGGFFQGLDEAGVAAVPLFLARALPYGVIERSTFETLTAQMLEEVEAAGHLDGILAAPHGATVAEGYPDADGAWLSALRQVVGHAMPVIATLDLHANVSPAMVKATDAMIAYATNPHLDQRETGRRAADMMSRTLQGRVRPVQAAAFPPMAMNIQSQKTAELPLSALYDRARGLAAGTLSHSILLGFPYADVHEMGSSVLVVTDDDVDQAQSIANAIGEAMIEMRQRFEPAFTGIPEAVEKARAVASTPVVLLDMGDNVGGGAPADSTAILQALQKGRVGPAFGCLFDPDTARAASKCGIGSWLPDRPIGDRVNPLEGRFQVISIHDGRFSEPEARHGGFASFDQGATAVLRSGEGNLTIMVTSRRMPPFSLRQMTDFGLDPADFRAIVAKGVIAPQAAYSDVAKGGFIPVDSPGVTRADMTKLGYANRRRPMHPFEEISRQFFVI